MAVVPYRLDDRYVGFGVRFELWYDDGLCVVMTGC